MAGQLRAPLITLDPLTTGVPALRVPLVTIDPLTAGMPTIRDSLLTIDPLTDGKPNLRNSLVSVDSLIDGYRNLRFALFCIESLHPVAPGAFMSTVPFPGSRGSAASMPGLAFTVKKQPKFDTIKHSSASGVSVRNSMRQFPIWEFECNYEFLEDRSGVNSSLKVMQGFFLSRQGQFDTFLYKDPDDYLVANDPLGTADGVTAQFSFKRVLGGYSEKVGQVDTGQPITLFGTINENGAIPAAGPYTVTVANSAVFVQDLGLTKAGTAMTLVTGVPVTGQYAVSAGVYTFAAADANAAVIIRYRYTLAPATYSIVMPNLVVFSSAPANGMVISAAFEFSFACIFTEDMLGFEKFMDKLWDLKKVTFESVPQ